MTELRHPSIVELCGFSKSLSNESDKVTNFIVMELCRCDLRSFLHDPSGIKKHLDLIDDVCGFIQLTLSRPEISPSTLEQLQRRSEFLHRSVAQSNVTKSEEFADLVLQSVFRLLIDKTDCLTKYLKSDASQHVAEGHTEMELESFLRSIEAVMLSANTAISQRTRNAFDELASSISLCKVSLRALLKPLSLPFMIKLSYEISRGMAYLHSLVPSILHGDLKSMNIMLTAKYSAKITDFGLAGRVERGRGMVGTSKGAQNPRFCAPEVLAGGEVLKESDVYSFAILMWEIMERKEPFFSLEYKRAMGMDRLKADVLKGTRPTLPDRTLSDEEAVFLKLMTSCWHADPSSRPSFAEIVQRLHRLGLSLGMKDLPSPFAFGENFSKRTGPSADIRGEFVRYIVAPHDPDRLFTPASQSDTSTGWSLKLDFLLSFFSYFLKFYLQVRFCVFRI